MSAQDSSPSPVTPLTPRPAAGASPLNEAIETVKAYARQETIGPLRGAGRWIAYGLVGAFLLAIGVAFLMLGVLRLLQTEVSDTFGGNWMRLLPYVAALAVGIIVIALAASRIGRKPLNKEP